MCLFCFKGYECDEIGVLVEVINCQFGCILVEIEQCWEVENCLIQYLEELESIVVVCIVELKVVNVCLMLFNQEFEEVCQIVFDMVQVCVSFLVNMSYEICMLLNGLFGMFLLSFDGLFILEQCQQLLIVYDFGKVLVELFNDVFDFFKFEVG